MCGIRAGLRGANAGDLRHQPVAEQFTHALQDGSLPAPLRLGQFRRVGDAKTGQAIQARKTTGARKQALIRAATSGCGKVSATIPGFSRRVAPIMIAPPASRKVPLVRTAYAEADGRALADPDPCEPQRPRVRVDDGASVPRRPAGQLSLRRLAELAEITPAWCATAVSAVWGKHG